MTNRPRARDLGIRIGTLEPGIHNSITDVAGVRVGHVTLVSGDGPLRIGHGPVRTGVTAVLPRVMIGTTTRSRLLLGPSMVQERRQD